MKYCIIQRVAFKTPGKKSRIVWAHVLAENEGLALVLVPKAEQYQSHLIYIAAENMAGRIFEPITPHCFALESLDVERVGDKFRLLGKSIMDAEFLKAFQKKRHDEF